MSTLTTSGPLITICMICKEVIGPDHQPLGVKLAAGIRCSHGLCRPCAPGYLATAGLSVEQTATLLASFDTQPATRNS